MDEMLTISEVAEASGLAASAIRYYESEGILPDPVRSPSGYRGYSADDVDVVRFVARLRALEFPLSAVREIVALRRDGKAPCAAVRRSIANELASIRGRISELERLERELRQLEANASNLPDDWPTDCVCTVIEGSESQEVR